jgi:glycosyltransferase involved in cell wall biosynthesis
MAERHRQLMKNGWIPYAQQHRPRIGIYDPNDHVSGLTRYVKSLLANLDYRDWDIVLYCKRGGPYEEHPRVQTVYLPDDNGQSNAPADWPRYSFAGNWFPLLRKSWRKFGPAPAKLWTGFLRDAYRLAPLFRHQPVELLHMQLVGEEKAALAARLANIPLVIGTFQIDTARSGFRDWVLEFITNHCIHQAIAVSSKIKQEWIRRTHIRSDRVITIPNSVDPQKFRRRSDRSEARKQLKLPGPGNVLIGSVGRLAPQKGYTYLLRAFAKLVPSYSNLYLILAGDGPLRPSLEEECQALQIASRVIFLGHCDDVQPVLDALDVFALSSLWEALPFSLLEAMAAELPAVGTSVAGVPEVIVAGETGFLVPAADPEALGSALRPLIESSELRNRFGKGGRQRIIHHFNESDMVRRTFEVYARMLARLRSAPHLNRTMVEMSKR